MVSTNARVPCFAQFTPWNNLNVKGQHWYLELWSRRVRSLCLSHIPWVILGKFFISLYILPVKCWERQLSLDLLHYYMCSLDCINTARPWLFYPGHFSRLFMQLIIMKDEDFPTASCKSVDPPNSVFLRCSTNYPPDEENLAEPYDASQMGLWRRGITQMSGCSGCLQNHEW